MPRKRVELDPDEIERLGRLGCTVEEVAGVFGLAQSSMSERLSREPLKTPWRRGLATAKVSVRRNLMRLAFEENNVAAAIWLSKILCRDQEPPRETNVKSEISTTATKFVAVWGNRTGDDLPPAGDDIDLLEDNGRRRLPAGSDG